MVDYTIRISGGEIYKPKENSLHVIESIETFTRIVDLDLDRSILPI
jgi:hypothetical protein